MYNLRFCIDENDKIKRCDFKKIPEKGELDANFYEKIILNEERLFQYFIELARKDINSIEKIKGNDIIHSFIVNDDIIKRLKADSYVLALEAMVNYLHNNS